MAPPKKNPGSGRGKKPNRSDVPFNSRIDPDLRAALDAFIEAQPYGASLKGVIEAALRDHLRAKGFWPWPPPAG
jgi:hypothetical protein